MTTATFGKLLFFFTALIAVGAFLLGFSAGAVFGALDAAPVTSTNGGEQTIEAKALTDHGCDSGEWHFVITQVRKGEDYAPDNIVVKFSNGQTVYVTLEKFTGKVAHYTTYGNLNSVVTQATARIYASWSGQFNLSHGPCPVPTPTPTSTPTVTPSPTPTLTGEPTPTPTTAPSSMPTVTPTSTPTPTDMPTTPAATPTDITPAATPAPAGTSVGQQPVSLPVTGGAPACASGDVSSLALFLLLAGVGLGGMIVGGALAPLLRK